MKKRIQNVLTVVTVNTVQSRIYVYLANVRQPFDHTFHLGLGLESVLVSAISTLNLCISCTFVPTSFAVRPNLLYSITLKSFSEDCETK